MLLGLALTFSMEKIASLNADAKAIKEHNIRHQYVKRVILISYPLLLHREGKYCHTCVVTLQNGCLCSNGTRKVTRKISCIEFLAIITVFFLLESL